jgi:bifunctional non-homologous end joining protein LigD
MARRSEDALATYHAKRRFDETPEPRESKASATGHLYTIQKHDATRLHYDLRLELDGVLKSWAVTRGPSFNPSDKRLAVRTEDHPVAYAMFEGVIPEGNYGAGTVLLWDRGEWEPIGDPHEGLAKGKLAFNIFGERLKGRWALVRFRGKEDSKRENWLLIKEKDDFVDHYGDVTGEHLTSVASGRDLEAIAADPERVWRSTSDQAEETEKPKARKGARAKVPEFVEPQLATLVDDLPEGPDWLFEMKFDGYRAQIAAAGADVKIYTRKGLDWTHRFPTIARAVAKLDLDRVLLDGEIVAIDGNGRSDFATLQQAIKEGNAPLSYFAFDLLSDGGKDLRKKILTERKERLHELLEPAGRRGPVFYTDHIVGNGQAMLDALCGKQFEGVIAKKGTAAYRSGRGPGWLKIKCGREQEFVIVGWSDSDKDRPFASLLLAVNDEEGGLVYSGRVGSGFSQETLRALEARFEKLVRKTSPLRDKLPRALTRDAHWVEPELVAQVAFAEFTREGIVRQGRFLGLREDKPAAEVRIEQPKPAMEIKKMTGSREAGTVAGVRLSHPDKVLFPQQGLTKADLATYLDKVAPRMLPHLSRRLVSFVRCPEGQRKQCFFQKHAGPGLAEAIKRQPIREKDGTDGEYLYIEDSKGLVSAAQMGVLEFHIWGSHIDDVDRPDRIVFDFDPDPTVDFETVKAASVLMRDALDALGLKSFPLLTGGKGVHVVAPLDRRHSWPVVKAFSKALAERFAENEPERYIATMSKAKRKGRIFIDYLRNERGSTAITPYSPRSREGAPVAWPVTWEGLDQIAAANLITVENFRERLEEPDPWQGYFKVRQSLNKPALRALGVED